jgi:SAM-dependent methyltransferase
VDALEAASLLPEGDPLGAASALQKQGFAPDVAAAALTLVSLRRKAAGKFGADAERMFLTRAGLEQATRSTVADRRARRLAGSASSVADLGCGIGADSLAFARAGLRVEAVDASPEAVECTSRNAAALGLAVDVWQADATEVDLSTVDAVFCDPARRTSGGRRVFDPKAYSPPWDFVSALPGRVPNTVLKLAPGIDHALLPTGAEGEWVSVDGEVVECAAWCGPLAEVPRRASVLRGVTWSVLTGSGDRQANDGPLRRYMYDPDGAVVRAHLVAELADRLDGTLADPSIAYVYADLAEPTPYARCYEVLERLPIALKKLRAALRALDVGSLTILKRGSALDVEKLRRDLRLEGSTAGVLALTRVAGEPSALFLRFVPQNS